MIKVVTLNRDSRYKGLTLSCPESTVGLKQTQVQQRAAAAHYILNTWTPLLSLPHTHTAAAAYYILNTWTALLSLPHTHTHSSRRLLHIKHLDSLFSLSRTHTHTAAAAYYILNTWTPLSLPRTHTQQPPPTTY